MKPTDLAIILGVITLVGAIFPAIFGWIVNRTGTAEKLRRVEYLIKRTELIEKFLSFQFNQIEKNKIPVEHLINELIDISVSIQNSSIHQQQQEHLDFDKRSLLKRIFMLPVPTTVGSWIGSGIFYMYSFASLGYIVMLGIVIFDGNIVDIPDASQFLKIFMFGVGLLFSTLLAWVGRRWAVKSALKAAILKGAHGEIANRSAQAMDKSVAP